MSTTKNFFIYPYRNGSSSIRNLRNKIPNIRVIKLTNSTFKDTEDKLIINWGSSVYPYSYSKVLNRASSVAVASNKLLTFRALREGEVPVPDFSVTLEGIGNWKEIVLRDTLCTSGGRGVRVYPMEIFMDLSEELKQSKLYVQYIKKHSEYRVHVFNGSVIHTQIKKKSYDGAGDYEHWRVRNSSNGWVFSSNLGELSQEIIESMHKIAIEAVEVLDLDFGAVDLIYNTIKGVFVLEVNTAPGIESVTLDAYARTIESLGNTEATNEGDELCVE